jgi:hypothetical protein
MQAMMISNKMKKLYGNTTPAIFQSKKRGAPKTFSNPVSNALSNIARAGNESVTFTPSFENGRLSGSVNFQCSIF